MKNSANERYLFVDTETGGIDPEKHSLLSIGCVVWEKNLGVIDSIEVFIKHKNYNITSEAARINKFNKEAHDIKSMDPKKVIDSLTVFLYQYFDENSLIPIIGHNIQFDAKFLDHFFRQNRRAFNRVFSYRWIDTYSVYKTLVLSGRINQNINSSSEAFEYFGIKVEHRHTALNDCLATVELYERLLEIIKN